MGIDLLREHLRTLAVQSRRKRLTRNVTPHSCIVAHARSARKGLGKQTAGIKPFGKAKCGVTEAAGLMTLRNDGMSNGPTLPMLPSSWHQAE